MIKIESNAKINLGLQVLNKRIDGFHNINTIFSRISLCDEIIFEENETIIIDIISDDNENKSNEILKIPLEQNLIYKAATKLQQRTKTNKGVKITLKKSIPMGGGLGGGSSNAAATLFALTKLWDIVPSTKDILIIAQTLGSDVPYFLQEGMAVAGSRGEKLNYFKIKLPYQILIVNPNIHISTPWAYSELNRDEKLIKAVNYKNIIFRALDNTSLFKEYIKNDFEKIVFNKYPAIKEIKRDLYKLGADFALMSGSGSTVFALFNSPEKINLAKKEFDHYQTHICDFIL